MSEEEEKNFPPSCKGESDFLEDIETFIKPIYPKSVVNQTGGFGNVYKIEHKFNSYTHVALKKSIRPKINLLQFFREVVITNRIRHPCTAELVAFNFVEKNSTGQLVVSPFIATPYYENDSLKSMLTGNRNFSAVENQYRQLGNMREIILKGSNKHKMKVDDGTVYTIIIYGIARALRHMHYLKFFHRDIKPANIFIDKNFLPHLGDYGLSREIAEDDEQSRKVGTKKFMAPEIWNSDRYYSFPADVYSLGLVFYLLTEGNYQPLSSSKVTHRFNSSHFSQIHDVHFSITPFPLQGLITSMLNINPGARPTMKHVCKLLENDSYWFPKTNPAQFLKYKQMIDDYEKAQFKLLDESHISHQSDYLIANNLLQNNFFGQKRSVKFRSYWALIEMMSKGDIHAKFLLGTIYFFGTPEIPKNLVLALRYFEDTKEYEHEAIQYIKMIHLERDEYDFQYKKLCKENKKPFSSDNIQSIYFSPKGRFIHGMIHEAKGEYLQAIKYYTLSAKQGIYEAKSRLAILLLKYVPKMRKKAETLLLHVTDMANKSRIDNDERKIALFFLAIIHCQNAKFHEALAILFDLLEQQYPDAAYMIAIIYHELNNFPEAIKYYDIAGHKFGNQWALQCSYDLSQNSLSTTYTYEYDYYYESETLTGISPINSFLGPRFDQFTS